MDAQKTGALIRKMRTARGMTQRALAEELFVSDKAVSKWERGMGLPDIAVLARLAQALGVKTDALLCGDMRESARDGGNMRRLKFCVCPVCGNVIVMTGEGQVSCCGRALEAMKPAADCGAHALSFQLTDGEIYASFDHPMDKGHYIRFVAVAGYDRVLLVKLYPEQGSEVRLPYMPHAAVYVGCSEEGLFVQKMLLNKSSGL